MSYGANNTNFLNLDPLAISELRMLLRTAQDDPFLYFKTELCIMMCLAYLLRYLCLSVKLVINRILIFLRLVNQILNN